MRLQCNIGVYKVEKMKEKGEFMKLADLPGTFEIRME
jgi:hypothetical protein